MTKSLTLNEVVLIFGMMLVTFGVRYPVLAIFGRIQLPNRIFRALRFVPPAVLTAIIAPSVLTPNGTLALRYTNAYLVAAIIAGIVAWRSKNTLMTIVAGMATFLIWRVLVGT